MNQSEKAANRGDQRQAFLGTLASLSSGQIKAFWGQVERKK